MISLSDAQLKVIYAYMEVPADLDLKGLQPVWFYWNRAKFPERDFPEEMQEGLIAQQVQKIFPQAVQEAPDGYLMVRYGWLFQEVPDLQGVLTELEGPFPPRFRRKVSHAAT